MLLLFFTARTQLDLDGAHAALLAPPGGGGGGGGGAPALPYGGARLYASLQHCGKFHPLFDAVLTAILERDPGAYLLVRDCGSSADSGDRAAIKGDEAGPAPLEEDSEGYDLNGLDLLNGADDPPGPSFGSRLLARGSKSGFSSRFALRVVVLTANLPLGAFLRLAGAAHVALEPFPFPASITTLDAFMVRRDQTNPPHSRPPHSLKGVYMRPGRVPDEPTLRVPLCLVPGGHAGGGARRRPGALRHRAPHGHALPAHGRRRR